MLPPARFERPATDTRKKKGDRYDVFGVKINRPMTLFGRPALLAWTSLEANPMVDMYCERPVVIPGTARVVDFWVRTKDSEYFIILLTPSELASKEQPSLPTKVQVWVDTSSTTVVLMDPSEDERRAVFLENWGSIIRDLSAFSRYVPNALAEEVLKAIRKNVSIEQLEQDFGDEDPVLVRIAAFCLLHQGRVLCPQLEKFELNSSMTFAPA